MPPWCFETKIQDAEIQSDLKGASSGHGLIGIQGRAQFLPEEFADSLFNCWDSGSASNDFHGTYVLVFQT